MNIVQRKVLCRLATRYKTDRPQLLYHKFSHAYIVGKGRIKVNRYAYMISYILTSAVIAEGGAVLSAFKKNMVKLSREYWYM